MGNSVSETIFNFFQNKVALNDDFVYFQDAAVKAGGMKYDDLQKKYPELAEKLQRV